MASPTWGVTPALLEDRRLSGVGVSTSGRTTGVVETVTAEFASKLEGELRSVGVDPATITEQGTPLSYAWLQSALLDGVAAAYGRAAMQTTTALLDQYWEEWTNALARLRAGPAVVLVDLPDEAEIALTANAAAGDLYR